MNTGIWLGGIWKLERGGGVLKCGNHGARGCRTRGCISVLVSVTGGGEALCMCVRAGVRGKLL